MRSSVGTRRRLLPVATCHANQARVVRVVLERLLVRAEPVQERSDLAVDELLVGDATERRHGFCSCRPSERRHVHTLIPGREHEHSPEIRDLCEPLAERAEVGFHDV